MAFQKIDQAEQHGLRIELAARRDQVADRVDDHHLVVELGNVLVHAGEVHLEAVKARTRRFDPQQALLQPRLDVDADRSHIARELRWRFFKG